MYDRDLALDELKLVQDLIYRQETYAHSVFKSAFIVVVGLMLAFLSERFQIEKWMFLVLSVVILLSFCYAQLIYRESFIQLIKRSLELQGYLRGDQESIPKGPLIYEAAHHLTPSKEGLFDAIKNPRFWFPNTLLLFMILSSLIVKSF